MSSRTYRFLQVFILIALSLFLGIKILSNQLGLYIHQRFQPLTVIAIIGLFLMGVALLVDILRKTNAGSSDHAHDHQHSNRLPIEIAILSVPLLLGWMIPARPLGASAIDSKGVSATAPLAEQGAQAQTFEIAADERNILDWIRLFNSDQDSSLYLGQTAQVIGFVYHDPRLPDGQFLVSRFTLVCCAADAFAIGIPVAWPQAADLPPDTWVKVSGPVEETQINEQRLPLIRAESVEGVDPPANFYLYP